MKVSIFLKAHSYVMVFIGLFSLFFTAQVSAQPQLTDDISAFFSSKGLIATKAMYPKLETARQMLDTQSLVGVNKFGPNE